jgi:hypothetical protein
MINTKEEYKCYLELIGNRFNNPNIQWDKWYDQFKYYEGHWENYFVNIFLNHQNKNKPVDLIFLESCPGGTPFPNQNYSFDSNRFKNKLDGTFDNYLKRICNHFDVNWKINKVNQSIEDIIIELSKKNVLMVDLYPTHGISLDDDQRKRLFNNVFETYSIGKLKSINNKLGNKINPKIIGPKEILYSGFQIMKKTLKIELSKALELKSNPIFGSI